MLTRAVAWPTCACTSASRAWSDWRSASRTIRKSTTPASKRRRPSRVARALDLLDRAVDLAEDRELRELGRGTLLERRQAEEDDPFVGRRREARDRQPRERDRVDDSLRLQGDLVLAAVEVGIDEVHAGDRRQHGLLLDDVDGADGDVGARARRPARCASPRATDRLTASTRPASRAASGHARARSAPARAWPWSRPARTARARPQPRPRMDAGRW